MNVAKNLENAAFHFPERTAVIENDQENGPPGDDRDMNVVSLAFVKEDRELTLPDQLGQPIGRRDVARRQ